MFYLKDESGNIPLLERGCCKGYLLQPGDQIHAIGVISNLNVNTSLNPKPLHAFCRSIEITRQVARPQPIDIEPDQLSDENLTFRLVRFKGTVRDIFKDEIDPLWVHFILYDNGKHALVAYRTPNIDKNLDRFLGTEVIVTGVCEPPRNSSRAKSGNLIRLAGPASIEIVRDFGPHPFTAPDISNISGTGKEISTLGMHCAVGAVVTVWQKRHLLLKTDDNSVVGVELRQASLPRPGMRIKVAGLPETDLFRINLSHAVWQAVDGPTLAPEVPREISAQELFYDNQNRPRLSPDLHGRAIALRGVVRAAPSSSIDGSRLLLDCDGHFVTIDLSSVSDWDRRELPGCEVCVSGICLMESSNVTPGTAFPHINNVVVVLRSTSDLTIVKSPPWWTPGRLFVVIVGLFVILGGILAWNIILNRLVERRGRELLRTNLERMNETLLMDERTRLSVELHDSVAQNLTGVSMQIDAAGHLLGGNPAKAAQYLAAASRTLHACREELRNVLWDLRSKALEVPDIAEAIRRTLKPHVSDTVIDIHFDVPRARITDNTMHALLRIIRELSLNAIRHGKADHLEIFGELLPGELKISVADNGCGFDVANVQGPEQGHFGIVGIQERIKRFNGTFEIRSNPKDGTCVTIAIPVIKHS